MQIRFTSIFIFFFFILFNRMEGQNIVFTSTVNSSDCNGANNGSVSIHPDPLNPPYSYAWSSGQTGSSVSGLAPGDYSVTIQDALLNDTTVNFTITERTCFIHGEIEFTPNGDGYNDTWLISNMEHYPDAEVLVYNRWGQKVFDHHGLYQPWDGSDLLGVPVPDGSYYYIVFGKKGDESTLIKGCVTIIR